jgi:hypothetical protein
VAEPGGVFLGVGSQNEFVMYESAHSASNFFVVVCGVKFLFLPRPRI